MTKLQKRLLFVVLLMGLLLTFQVAFARGLAQAPGELPSLDTVLTIAAFGVVWSFLLDWGGGFAAWFDALPDANKKWIPPVVMGAVVLALWGAGCLGLINSSYTCDVVGLKSLLPLLYLSIAGLNGFHNATKPTAAKHRAMFAK